MTAPALPTAPREVHWRAWAGQRQGLLLAAALLGGAALAWIALAGVDPAAVFAAPAAGGGDPTAAAPVGLLLLPALVCVLRWLRAAWRVKRLLETGRAAPAEVLFWQRVRFVVPAQIRVGYRIAAPDAPSGRRTQWIGAASAAADCLRHGGAGLGAVYDPARPQASRLVAARQLSGR